ncbi:hypothetical protein L1987_72273 [Smallanthus sonchifolius]|uniref:Uncharacterized protein n=1 Tax=Smallanthus sonchifolius TaxID=185202 RepID=A0ACB9AU60_9ASTR|nr:hypothetical protein L1987_72273 [Smallanthus sonchifolius]
MQICRERYHRRSPFFAFCISEDHFCERRSRLASSESETAVNVRWTVEIFDLNSDRYLMLETLYFLMWQKCQLLL